MAQSGVSFEMNFAAEIKRATAVLQSTPKQLEKASHRAAKKTMKWMNIRISREMSQALNLPSKVLKHRMSMNKVDGNEGAAYVLWMGTAPLAAEKVGKVRQTKKGVSAGKLRYQGAFYKAVYGGDAGVWIRKSRAAALGLNLPRLGGKKQKSRGGSYDKGRFPVQRVAVDLDNQGLATEIFRRYDRRAMQQFSKILEQELNFVVNHERR